MNTSTGSEDPRRDAERVVQLARDEGVEFVHLQFTDIPGTIKGVSIPAERLAISLDEGVWFDGSSVEGLARLAESDLYLAPDPSTFAVLPWEQVRTARLVCDLRTPDRQPFVADPRGVLKRALADAAERGFAYRAGAEVEFYLFEERSDPGKTGARGLIPPDARSYFELPVARAAEVCSEAVKVLRGFGFRVSASHHEVSPGQYEIDLSEDDALRTADAIAALKLAVRTLAGRHGLAPTFMPKPKTLGSGSGLHVSQILVDPAGENVFVDPAGQERLSAAGQSFIAGQLAHARGMCALLAPLVNSYKRLLGGGEAPSRVTWATVSRGSFIRVPRTRSAEGEAIEVRAADPSCNPYLALAVLLQTGLAGIDQRLPLPPPDEYVIGNGVTEGEDAVDLLPSTLGEALEELGWDMVVREALGQSVFERFLAAKEREWSAYRHHVSDWELETYLETA